MKVQDKMIDTAEQFEAAVEYAVVQGMAYEDAERTLAAQLIAENLRSTGMRVAS